MAAAGAPPALAADLGPGGGIPGLVLAATWPSSRWFFLEASTTRATFLTDVIAGLGWSDRIEVRAAPAEDSARDPQIRGQCDLVVARSFASPAVTAECGTPLLRQGSLLLVSEPPTPDPRRWPADGVAALGLQDEGEVRSEVGAVRVLRLVGEVEDTVPRRAGVPARRPRWDVPRGTSS